MTFFAIIFFSYFLFVSGIIYDVIVEPPSIGMTKDERTGANKPVAFLQYRLNGQYIVEGLTAGFFFGLGGLGFILVDQARSFASSKHNRTLFALAGVLLIGVSYALCLVFLRIKIPNY